MKKKSKKKISRILFKIGSLCLEIGIGILFGIALGAEVLLKAAQQSATEKQPMILVSHRAGAAYAAENTVEALERTIADGASIAEIDVQQLADGSAQLKDGTSQLRDGGQDLDSGVDLSTFKLQIDSQTAIGIADCTYSEITNGYAVTYTPKAAIADGSHTITASVSDHDGNVSNIATTKIKIDTVPPTLTLSSPADKSFINKKTCIVAGVTNDVTSSPVSVTIKVGTTDQGAVTVGSDGSFSKEVTLAEGANTITITAKDSLGKTTTMTRTVTVDTAPPVFESVTLSPNPVDAGKTYTISVKVKS